MKYEINKKKKVKIHKVVVATTTIATTKATTITFILTVAKSCNWKKGI